MFDENGKSEYHMRRNMAEEWKYWAYFIHNIYKENIAFIEYMKLSIFKT